MSNLETRGNEAFSGLINGLLQKQEGNFDSAHLPNKGKKCLVFSDSRQQAANIAVELGQLSNHDESRRILFQMLNEDWFKSLGDEHKSISGMFPWFSMFCASKAVNPFAGGEHYGDRSLFASSGLNCIVSILTAKAVKFEDDENIEFGDHKNLIEELVNSVKPKQHPKFSFENLNFHSRRFHVKDKINDLFPKWDEIDNVSTKTKLLKIN